MVGVDAALYRCVLAMALPSLASAFTFRVPPGATECFEEHAGANDHILGNWALNDEAHRKDWRVEVSNQLNASAQRPLDSMLALHCRASGDEPFWR